MDIYGIKFFRNDVEIELDEVPTEYLNGIMDTCRSERASRERWNRVVKNMIDRNTK